MEAPEIPLIEVSHFLEKNDHADEECRKVVYSLLHFGVLIIKDPVGSLYSRGCLVSTILHFSTSWRGIFPNREISCTRESH